MDDVADVYLVMISRYVVMEGMESQGIIILELIYHTSKTNQRCGCFVGWNLLKITFNPLTIEFTMHTRQRRRKSQAYSVS